MRVDDQWLRSQLAQHGERYELTLLTPGLTFRKGVYVPGDDPERGFDLADLDFSRTEWQPGCVLKNAHAERTIWNEAHLTGCDLTGMLFQESTFRFTHFMNCVFTEAKLGPGSTFFSGGITGGVFAETDASSIYWHNWIFNGVTFDRVDFTHARFGFCKFIDCTMENCTFAHSVLDGFKVEGGFWSDIDFAHTLTLYNRLTFHPAAHQNIPILPKSYGETLKDGER